MTILTQLLALLDDHQAALVKWHETTAHWEIQYDTQPEAVASIARQRMDAECREWERIGRQIEDFCAEFENEIREALRVIVTQEPSLTGESK